MMIVQSVLFFILGVVTTAFAVMLLAPVLWRRALSLSYKAARAQVPLSLKEVEADRDFLRVRHAVDLCRLEEKLKAEQDAHVGRRQRLDSAQERIHALASLEPLCAQLKNEVEKNGRLIDGLRQKLGEREQQLRELLHLKPLCEAQKKQLQEHQRKISRLETSNEKLKEKLKSSVRIDQQALRSFRHEIKSIAAKVAAGVAAQEGAASPIRKLTADAADEESLAASIRNLSQKTGTRATAKVRYPETVKQPASPAPLKAGS